MCSSDLQAAAEERFAGRGPAEPYYHEVPPAEPTLGAAAAAVALGAVGGTLDRKVTVIPLNEGLALVQMHGSPKPPRKPVRLMKERSAGRPKKTVAPQPPLKEKEPAVQRAPSPAPTAAAPPPPPPAPGTLPRKPPTLQEEAVAAAAARQARQALLGSKAEEVQEFVTASVEAHRAAAPPASGGMMASLNAVLDRRRAGLDEESVYTAAQDDDGWYSQS